MRLLLLVLIALALAVLSPLASQPSLQRLMPPFLELDEHGFDPYTSLCKSEGRTTVTTANVNVISGDSTVQVGSNKGCATPQNETTLAVNPANPLNLVAGANDYRLCCDSQQRNDGTGWAYWSNDGGVTWSNVLLPALTRETGGWGRLGSVDSAGDPAVAFSADGSTVYYTNIVFSRSDEAASGIVLSESRYGGKTWLRPRIVYWTHDASVFNDKEWVATGPNGELVVTWTRFHATSPFTLTAEIWGRLSRDGGRTWSAPARLVDSWHPYNQGSQPVFDKDGNLYVFYETASPPLYETDAIGVTYVPRDGLPLPERPQDGFSFLSSEVDRVYDEVPDCFPANDDRRATLTGEQFRTSTMPAAAVDPVTGTAVVAWVDGQQGCHRAHTSAQVKLAYVHYTHKQGLHHSPVTTITSGADKAFPAVAYRDGVTTVGFYTRSFATDGVSLDYAYASSRDGFLEHRLSDGSSNPGMQFNGAFIGDFSGLAVGSDGVAHALWTDSRGGDQNTFAQAFTP